MSDKSDTTKCPEEYWLRVAASLRLTRACKKRTGGFMVNHWKCLGRDHKDCPLNEVRP